MVCPPALPGASPRQSRGGLPVSDGAGAIAGRSRTMLSRFSSSRICAPSRIRSARPVRPDPASSIPDPDRAPRRRARIRSGADRARKRWRTTRLTGGSGTCPASLVRAPADAGPGHGPQLSAEGGANVVSKRSSPACDPRHRHPRTRSSWARSIRAVFPGRGRCWPWLPAPSAEEEASFSGTPNTRSVAERATLFTPAREREALHRIVSRL